MPDRTPPLATAAAEETAGPPSLIDKVADWLIEQALGESDLEKLYQGCCDRSLGAGVPLWRGHISFSILHPLYASMGLTWRRDHELDIDSYPYAPGGILPERFRANPLYHLIRAQVPFLRRRLVGDEAVLDFPVLSEFRAAGATDYLAFSIPFGARELDGMVGSWATDRPSGFSETDIRSLLRIQQRLGVACKMRVKERIARNVVTTYLGPLAGQRVLDGQIQRGDGETIRAVIWYSDLRGSTGMADTLSRDAFIQALNDYFECAAGAVLAHGGEILAFVGDAVLAIFPLDKTQNAQNAQHACERALAASRDARERLSATNQRRRATAACELSFGLALHLGDVLFGNIGVPERVSFSVIGPTVNEVARLEALTKELNRPVLASSAFARQTSVDWERLGTYEMRGVATPIEVLSPAGDPGAAPSRD